MTAKDMGLTVYTPEQELLDVVDQDDNVTGVATRAEIHSKGLIHRAVHIFLFSSQGLVYVQMRSSSKDRFPCKLDSSAAGHVDTGETYDHAASRELMEELGIDGAPARVLKVQASEITDMEHVVLYSITSDQVPRPDPDEITWGKFMTPEELTKDMEHKPDDYVPVFIHLWKTFMEPRK